MVGGEPLDCRAKLHRTLIMNGITYMARKTVVELLDDIDGTPAAETLVFSLDGGEYQIDLSGRNAQQLRDTLAPFVEKARKAGRAPSRGAAQSTPSSGSRERSAEVRAWAKQHGIQVNDRGRIPANVVEAFEAKDPSRAKAPGNPVPQVAFQAVSNP